MTKKPFNPPPPKERREASVIAFRAFYWIHSWAVYRASQLDPDGVDADYPPDLGDTELGAAARAALLASRFIGPDHPDWGRVGAYYTPEKDKELSERFLAELEARQRILSTQIDKLRTSIGAEGLSGRCRRQTHTKRHGDGRRLLRGRLRGFRSAQ